MKRNSFIHLKAKSKETKCWLKCSFHQEVEQSLNMRDVAYLLSCKFETRPN